MMQPLSRKRHQQNRGIGQIRPIQGGPVSTIDGTKLAPWALGNAHDQRSKQTWHNLTAHRTGYLGRRLPSSSRQLSGFWLGITVNRSWCRMVLHRSQRLLMQQHLTPMPEQRHLTPGQQNPSRQPLMQTQLRLKAQNRLRHLRQHLQPQPLAAAKVIELNTSKGSAIGAAFRQTAPMPKSHIATQVHAGVAFLCAKPGMPIC